MRVTNRSQSILVLVTRNARFAGPAITLHKKSWILRRSRHGPARSFSSRRINIPSPFPVVPSCPEPTCPCAPTPVGLNIDHAQNLNGTMAPYSMQVLPSTGQSSWKSRIEEDGLDEEWGILGRSLRGLIGRGGKYSDVW